MPFSSRRTTRTENFSEPDDRVSVVSFHSHDLKADNTSDVSVLELANSIPTVSSGECTLTAHNISYHVNLPTKCWEKDKQLPILTNITGIFQPGLNTILGNFGAGKTSLLNVLAGRVDKSLVEGDILLNGHLLPRNFKSMVGFVPQNDFLYGILTLRENIAFSSSLRLPNCLSRSERKERIDSVIKELELEHYADMKAGTACLRGVTPGTRKLCSIGMELVICPPVLFLDEPTTFLDPITANLIILFLKRLSNKGRTIICSVTQPRYSAYKLFDNVSLLSSGNTIFHGLPRDALEFFKEQGYKCPKLNNPADFFMEVINADQTSIEEYRTEANSQRQQSSSTGDSTVIFYDRLLIQNKLVNGFASSKWCAALLQRAAGIYSEYERRQRLSPFSTNRTNSSQTTQRARNAQQSDQYPASVFNQLFAVSTRTIKNLIKNPERGIKTIATTIFFSIIMMGIYWQLKEDPVTGFPDRGGVLFFLVLVQLFFNISSLELFFRERPVLLHENKSGFYRISVYFFVKIFCDILPQRIATIGLMSILVYFAIGLRNNSESFFSFMLCLLMVSMTAAGTSFLVASTFETFAMGQVTMSLLYMFMLLFSGYMINLGSLAPWISWIQYLSMIKYGLTALYVVEFKDRTFCSGGNTTCRSGNSYLSENDMDFDTDWDLWKNYFALFLLCIAVFGFSYIQLRRMAAR